MFDQRPGANEYAEYYTDYVKLVPDGTLLSILFELHNKTIHLLKDLSTEQALFRYGSSKWSIKEVLGHIIDTERIMSFRLLSIARGETVALPGYDENEYVKNANFDQQTIGNLLESYTIVRKSTLHLLKGLDEKSWIRRGVANNYEVTVRALAAIIVGHELHHLQILNDRYISDENFPK
ncbi:DinB family protein [Peribacillus acanthi]|uniref:DinB family protein n=1 Tax=Peribacillus acanthi TaxID=2171554 RepID=UPI000D3E2E1A|nr:DinB family protein [Peribacillus acanthi]